MIELAEDRVNGNYLSSYRVPQYYEKCMWVAQNIGRMQVENSWLKE
jgi:hypothetical protein